MDTENLDLSINEHQLDDEWINQPELYSKWAINAADARRDYDEAKAELDVMRAELDRAIRSDPEYYKLTKVTESVIASTVVVQPIYKDLQKKVIDAKHSLDVCSAVVGALDHRRSALSKLVDLFLADYFSKPKPSKRAKEHTDDIERKRIRKPRKDRG